MNKKHAVGILVCGRYSLTEMVLMSLYYSDQSKDDYDLFLIDNASDRETQQELRAFCGNGMLPIRNLFILPVQASISQAWNLFLAVTQDYEYRTKIDNDMVMLGTVTPPSKPKKRGGVPESHPDEVDPLGGAPRSVSIVGGVNSPVSRLQTRSSSIYGGTAPNDGLDSGGKHSRFLDHLEGCAKEFNTDLTALAPIGPKSVFPAVLDALNKQSFEGRPFLLGAFMMISRRAFETLGYFDERLPRRESIEYSQRAIKSRLFVAYHPEYWAVHIGQNKDTVDVSLTETQESFAIRVMQEQPLSSPKASSVWTKVSRRILDSASKNKIVNLK